MIYLFKGCGIDNCQSVLAKTKEYIQTELRHNEIKEVNSSDRLDILRYFNCDDIKCIVVSDIHLYHKSVQKSLIPIVKEASKTKDIVLLIDKIYMDEDKNPIIRLADKTVEIELDE
ncbi:MAG: hypothetical protein J6A59_01565 [Lachnospiraceae bacterium]|nr:hypothetical protein [Lachnospiraceae bacterium]